MLGIANIRTSISNEREQFPHLLLPCLSCDATLPPLRTFNTRSGNPLFAPLGSTCGLAPFLAILAS